MKRIRCIQCDRQVTFNQVLEDLRKNVAHQWKAGTNAEQAWEEWRQYWLNPDTRCGYVNDKSGCRGAVGTHIEEEFDPNNDPHPRPLPPPTRARRARAYQAKLTPVSTQPNNEHRPHTPTRFRPYVADARRISDVKSAFTAEGRPGQALDVLLGTVRNAANALEELASALGAEVRPNSRIDSAHDKAPAPAAALITVKEAATYLHISVTKLYEIIGRGELRTVRIGKTRRITHADLVDFIDQSRS